MTKCPSPLWLVHRNVSILYFLTFFLDLKKKKNLHFVKADFHSVEFSDWTGNPLLMCENFAVNLNRMLRVTKVLLCKIWPVRKNSTEWKSTLKDAFFLDVEEIMPSVFSSTKTMF